MTVLRKVIYALVALLILFLIFYLFLYSKARLGEITVIDINKSINIGVNNANLKILNTESKSKDKLAPIVFVSNSYVKTTSGAGYRGIIFLYSKWSKFLNLPVFIVYVDKAAIEKVSIDDINKSTGNFFIRQLFENRGVEDTEIINKFAYIYGIETTNLIRVYKK